MGGLNKVPGIKYQVLRKKIKASTMLEALVAMVIILGAFTVTCMIYVNVTTSDNSRQKLDAQLLMNELALKTKQEKSFIDEKTETDFLIIEKTISKYPNAENLNQLTIIVSNKEGKIIAAYNELLVESL